MMPEEMIQSWIILSNEEELLRCCDMIHLLDLRLRIADVKRLSLVLRQVLLIFIFSLNYIHDRQTRILNEIRASNKSYNHFELVVNTTFGSYLFCYLLWIITYKL